MKPRAGDRFGDRFELVLELGSGGAGAVWIARDHLLGGREVALKLMRPDRQSARSLARFDREAQILTRLDHPNIAKLFDANLGTDPPYLVMELVRGTALDQELKFRSAAGERMKVEECAKIILDACAAVIHAHELGVVHRDLKPANMIVHGVGELSVKVIDFGLAKIFDPDPSGATTIGRVLGSPMYRAPELCRGEISGDPRIDVYGLGVVLWEVLTLRRPFAIGEDRAPIAAHQIIPHALNPRTDVLSRIVHDPRVPPSAYAEVSPALDALVLRAMSSDPNLRPPSVRAFSEELVRAMAESGVEHPERTRISLLFARPAIVVQQKPSRFLYVGAMLALMIAVALTTAVLSRAPSRPTEDPEPGKAIDLEPKITARSATSEPELEPEPEPEPERAPDREPPPIHKPRPRTAAPAVAVEPPPAPLAKIRLLLARTKEAPNDSALFGQLNDELLEKIATLPNSDQRATLKKKVNAAWIARDPSMFDGVVSELSRAIDMIDTP